MNIKIEIQIVKKIKYENIDCYVRFIMFENQL